MSGSKAAEKREVAPAAQPGPAPTPQRGPARAFNPYRAFAHTSYRPSATSSTATQTRSYVTKTRGYSLSGSSTSTPVGGAPGHTTRTRGLTATRASLATAAVHPHHPRVTPSQRADTRSICPHPRRVGRAWTLRWSIALATVVSGSAATVVKAVVLGHPATASPLSRAAAVAARCGASPGEAPCGWWRGINLYSGYSDELGTDRAAGAIQTISGRDANNYVVYVPELQTASDGTVSAGAQTISDQHLVQAGDQSSADGAVAVLKPHISDPTNFAGGPGFVSSYAAVLEHYGQIATQMKAQVFVIATELSQIYRDPQAMNSLIDAAERSYSVPGGRIAVAINWDQLHEALSFPWLQRVSLIGIDGYWPLGSGATVSDIYNQWKRPGNQTDGTVETPGQAVSDLSALGKDVVFTEIGYQECQGAAADPSSQPNPSDPSSCGSTATDPREQEVATQAAYCYWTQWAHEHGDPSWFRGLWWWDWDLSQSANVWDVKSGAEGVIRAWNTGQGGSCPDIPA